jgi:cyclophilin family peptidyl-prolyl cis-trans isomerase
MPSRSRERQLAKLAARRKAEQSAAQRRKRIIGGIVGGLVGLAAIGIGVAIIRGGNDNPVASGSPSATGSPSAGLPTKTGTVTPKGTPAKTVACGGTVPADADAPKPQFDAAPSPDLVLKDNLLYTAVLQTSCGTIEIQLDASGAPATVASFVFLADKGYFDGQFFHRVVDSIDVIQGGDPLGTGSGGPGYSIPDELTGHENYTAGSVAMAESSQPNTGGSQFFIITGPQGTNLNGNPNYTIFGRVVKGLDVAKTINALMPKGQKDYDGAPTEAVYLEKVSIRTEKKPSPPPSASPSS